MTLPAYKLPNPKPLTSATGELTLKQFIQTVLVGVSGLPGELVRPNWQINPPKQPDIETTWLAFGITSIDGDANAYVAPTDDGLKTNLYRQELLEIQISIYGIDAEELAGMVRDAFQLDQNRWALTAAQMGYAYHGATQHVPDLINERWYNRVIMSLFIRRQIQRVYPVPTLVAANGTIFTSTGQQVPWLVTE